MTDPRSSALEKLRTSRELHSPFLFARAWEVLTSKIRSSVAWRRPPETAENQQAIAILESEAAAVPKKELIPPRRGRPNASYWLKHTEADSQAFSYASEELHIAAAFCAAELQVSRELKIPDLELHMFDLVASANGLIAGWWRGRQLGLIKFLASAANHNGATFTLNGVCHRAWGLEPQASLERILRAMKDMAEFSSSLHPTAWKIRAWPALLTGTQTTMILGWIALSLFSFCRDLPERCELHHNVNESSSEEELGDAKKRGVEKEQAQEAELDK